MRPFGFFVAYSSFAPFVRKRADSRASQVLQVVPGRYGRMFASAASISATRRSAIGSQ